MRNWLLSMEFNLWSDFFFLVLEYRWHWTECPVLDRFRWSIGPELHTVEVLVIGLSLSALLPQNLPMWMDPFNQDKLSPLSKHIKRHTEGWVRLTDTETSLPNKRPFTAADLLFPLSVSILDFFYLGGWWDRIRRISSLEKVCFLCSCIFSVCCMHFIEMEQAKIAPPYFFLLFYSHCPERYNSYFLNNIIQTYYISILIITEHNCVTH